jgi:hypothetical protein
VGKEAKVGNPVQVGADFWPLVALPDFVTGTPGSENVTVKQNKTKVLPPGAYGDIVVKKKGRLILTGGRYAIRSLRAGQQSKVWFEGESRVLVDERLRTDSRSYFGPRQYSGVDASEILVYVNGKNGENGKLKSSPKAAQVGIQAQFLANLYAPNGTLWLRQRSRSEGAFIGRDVRVGIRADVRINSSWSAPSGTPSPKPVLAKPTLPAETESEDSNLAFGLDQNYPNPFNPSTTIRYTLAEESTVRLVVYNVLGQEVRVLVDKTLAEGAYDVAWDGKDTIGRAVSSGVYMYLLEATSQVVVRKMVFAK